MSINALKNTILWLITFIAVVICIKSLYHIITTSAPDFSVLWTSTHDLINFKNPYTNPSLFTIDAYPPSTFLLYIPFALIPYKLAQAIFVILSFLTIPAIVIISLKVVFGKININHFLIFLSLTLLSFPTKFTLGMGQINLIAAFILICSFYFYKNKKFEISGIIMGAACLLKPVFVLILLFFILKMKWKVVFFSFLIPLISTILIVLIFGTTPFIYWVEKIIPQLMGVVGREVYYNQGVMGFISRITQDLTIRIYLSNTISFILILLSSSITILKRKDENLQFALLITTLLLIDTLSWQHHFVWLIFPFILITKYAIKIKKRWFWALSFLAYLLVSWNFKNPSAFEIFPKSLFLSNTFYGGVIIDLLTLYCIKKI